MFSASEKEARYRAVRQVLNTEDLKAIILVGDMGIGPGFYGDLRYLTDYRVFYYRQVVVVFPNSEPVLFIESSESQRRVAAERSFVNDCRASSYFAADVANLLKDRGVVVGRVGVSFEMLPTAWFMHFKKELPQIEWEEVHERILQVRLQRSEEEADIYRKGAALADGGFEAVVKMIRPKVSEQEIVAEIEHFARARGAEECFTLITSGKFALGDKNMLGGLHVPSPRLIEIGDTVEFEITPRYGGYWTQLVRRVNVGYPNHALSKLNTLSSNAIKKGLEHLNPGRTVADVFSTMKSHVNKGGYELSSAVGHICGVDLVEARLNGDNKMVLTPGTAIIIHPRIFTPDRKSNSFWGETYLLTHEGYERLNHIGDEVLTI